MISPLSRDRPRGLVLTLIVIAIVAGLALAPFLFPGQRALDTAARICIFIVLVASYDLLLGYTGIVSFAHTMFFGMGAYGVAIALAKMGASFTAIAVGTLAGVAVAAAVALVIALFSLRVRAIFFAMVTLAVASAFLVLVSQLSWLTGGEDGINFSIPRELTPGFRIMQERVLGVNINGRLLLYYVLFALTVAIFLFLLRVVNSPFGRVLQAIRENAFRAEAIGYPVVRYRTISTVLSAALAAVAGAMIAVWLRYSGPATTLSLEIMIDILLIVVIGGLGTLYGAVVGSVLLILAQSYLPNIMKVLSDATADIPVLSAALHPDRWLLWLGVLFILSVYFFPSGIVGQLRGKK